MNHIGVFNMSIDNPPGTSSTGQLFQHFCTMMWFEFDRKIMLRKSIFGTLDISGYAISLNYFYEYDKNIFLHEIII